MTAVLPVLDGIRVLDFGRFIAGPYCAALLGDLGADVVRIEKRGASEDRHLVPLAVGADLAPSEGAMFLQMNRNKRGMTLDPAHPEGRAVVRRLVQQADVIVANLPPPTLTDLGLDWPSVEALNPRAILVAISAFGPNGPYAERVGFDGVAQAMSGAMYLTGAPGEPMRSYIPWVDFGTASLAAFGAVAALYARTQTGRGQCVEGTLLGTALTYGNMPLAEQATRQLDRTRTGNRSQTAAPSDLYRTRDGHILVAINGLPLFRRWAKLMGEPHWANDPRFQHDHSRGDARDVISARMQAWCGTRTSAEALEALEAARIPAGPVMAPQEVLDDPHVAAMGLLQTVGYPGLAAPAPITGTPVRLSAQPGALRRRPPLLGEHTAEVLEEYGFSAAEIAALAAAGVT